MRGPLQLLHDMWDSTEETMSWVAMLQESLEVVHDMLREKITEAKTKQKLYHDKKTKMRHFQVGDMVLTGLAGKLEDSWEDLMKLIGNSTMSITNS